jgi:hypothetical protein
MVSIPIHCAARDVIGFLRSLGIRDESYQGTPLQETPRHAKRTEGYPKQHYRGTAVRNTNTWAKELPEGKTVSATCGWNRDDSA